MKLRLGLHGRWLAAIAVLVIVAVACGAYIVNKQRLRTPFGDRYTVNAEFATTNGLNPGLGQPVNVAGVRVGTVVTSRYEDGVSVVQMEIESDELEQVNEDARVTLVPNTPLKDMLIEIDPGTPGGKALEPGSTIPVDRTTPPIDSDEFTSALDTDTREYMNILIGELDRGTRGRGQDMRGLLRAFGPTVTQARQLSDALVARRQELRRLVHSLNVLGTAVGERDDDLGRLVDGADATFGALADEDAALASSLELLPGTLSAARRSLRRGGDLAREIPPTLEALEPSTEMLPGALEAAAPVVRDAEALLRTKLRPFVRKSQSLLGGLAEPLQDLTAVTPALRRSFLVLNYVVNELAYNPPGDNEGFLFWTAWFAHNGNVLLSVEDAHGAVGRGFGVINCDSFTQNPEQQSALAQLLTGIDPGQC